nr:ATP-dependent DNA helicase MER3 -like protein [Tanacetum cinerariifolium]
MNNDYSNPFINSSEQQERLREASLSCGDKQIQSYILYDDCSLIEGPFLNGDLQVLCTTNTLAHGSNLPAHTIIIKSTQYLLFDKCMMEVDPYIDEQTLDKARDDKFAQWLGQNEL